MALGIASGVLAFLIWLACFLIVLIIGGFLFGIPWLIVSAMKVEVLFWIYAALVGIPFLVIVILLFASIGLPFSVFFKNFAL